MATLLSSSRGCRTSISSGVAPPTVWPHPRQSVPQVAMFPLGEGILDYLKSPPPEGNPNIPGDWFFHTALAGRSTRGVCRSTQQYVHRVAQTACSSQKIARNSNRRCHFRLRHAFSALRCRKIRLKKGKCTSHRGNNGTPGRNPNTPEDSYLFVNKRPPAAETENSYFEAETVMGGGSEGGGAKSNER